MMQKHSTPLPCLTVWLLLVSAESRADAVLDWNQLGVSAVLTAQQSPPDGARAMAIMHLAMFNAVNAIVQGYAPFAAGLRPTAGASAPDANGKREEPRCGYRLRARVGLAY